MLNVSSIIGEGDLTARAVIRNAALRLFAVHGPDAVSVRQIAAEAKVSPALVLHHFGSKVRLREAVDAHVAGVFDSMLEMIADGLADALVDPASGGLAAAFAEGFPPDSPLPGYLRRLLLAGDPAGRELFLRWYAATAAVLDQLTAAGVALPSEDPVVRAALLLSNDLGIILLRPLLREATGVDPLSPEGAYRFVREAGVIYTDGAFTAPPTVPEEKT
jgi:AcrR family transcriptional regulator